jgi:hypothetical protein
MGGVAGVRSRIGINTTLINQRVNLSARPVQSLDLTTRGNLIDDYVTPMKTIGKSGQFKDDLTTVSDDNTTEKGFRYGFSRLVVDFLIESTHKYEEGSVGGFNSPGEAERIQDLLTSDARLLEESAVIYDYSVNVEFDSPTKMSVEILADVAEPIRFIENKFTIGEQLFEN